MSRMRNILEYLEESTERFPEKTIWLYTGGLWEDVCKMEIIHYIDVLVDGEFEVERKELNLQWKGSANQRVIDVPETLEKGEIQLHEENR